MKPPRHRPIFLTVILGVLLVLGPGCAFLPGSNADSTNQTPYRLHDFTPEQYGKLGAFLHQNPGQTDKILRANQLSRGEFESAVRTIASDAELATRYQKAFQEELSG